MNPKPLVALNHFTVPLAITSSPRDQKIQTNFRSPQTGMSDGARYAVWAALDSANDTLIPAENDHYRGAFVVFARFAIICRDARSPAATGYGSAKPGKAGHQGRQRATK